MQDKLTSGPSAETRDGIAADASPSRGGREGPRQRTASSRVTGTAKGKPKAATARPASKQARVIELLRRKDGASVAAIMNLTNWQKHSVHGFFAGVIRKKLHLKLVRTGEAEKAMYRIASGAPGAARTGKTTKPAKPRKPAVRKSSRKRAR